MKQKYTYALLGLVAAFAFVFMVLGVMTQTAESAVVSKTNSTAGSADWTFITRTVNFGPADFALGANISDVNIDVIFEKLSGSCPTHNGGNPFNKELYMFLTGPTGAKAVLVEDSLNSGGSGLGPTYTSNTAYGGQVTVTFDDSAAATVGGPAPTSGAFKPVEALSVFRNTDPLGTWMLTFGDNAPGSPSCFYEFTLTIDANQPPIVNDQVFSVTETAPVGTGFADVVATDPDPNDKPVYVITAGNIGGAFAIGALSGGLTVTNPLDYEITPVYTLTVQVTDNDGLTDTAQVRIDVLNVNEGPTAVDDTGSTDEDTLLSVSAPGLLANDDDPDGDPLSVSAFDAASAYGAAVNVASDGGYTYDPLAAPLIQALAQGDLLTDTFGYTISDSGGLTDTAVVTITVDGLNDAPDAVGDLASTPQNMPVNISVLSNDDDIDNGDSISVVGVGSPGNGASSTDGTTVTYTPTAAFVGTDVFTYTIADLFSAQDTASITVTVANITPTLANVAITSPIDENDLATLSGTISDPGPLDTFTLSVVWGDGSSDLFNYVAGTTSFSETHQYLDDNPTATPSDSYTVDLSLSDNHGATDTDQVTVTVNNVPPTLSSVFATPVTIDENDTLTLTAVISDVGSMDTFTLTVDWGDGAMDTYTYGAGTGIVTQTHQYLDDDPSGTASDVYDIDLNLSDDDGGTATASTAVTVNNLDPSLSAVSVTPSVSEGGTATLTGAIGDVGSLDTFSLQVNWGDGGTDTYIYPAGTAAFTETHQYVDDDPTGTTSDNYTISLTLTDDDLGSSGATTSVTVNNVAPILSGVSVTSVDEGSSATLSGSITDPGTADTFTLDVLWGDGNNSSVPLAAGATSFNVPHTYLDDDPTGTPSDTYTITITLTDDDTGSDGAMANNTVSNVAPTANAGPDQMVSKSSPTVFFSGSYTDPGTLDTFQFEWDFGDGFTTTGTLNPSHTYPGTVATYTVTLTVTDDDTGTDSDTMLVNVISSSPNAVDDTASTLEDAVLIVPAPGVLFNDSDPDGDSIAVSGFDPFSANGAPVSVSASGAYTYDPTAAPALQALAVGELLTDTFSYTITDTDGATGSATVFVGVIGQNDPPLALGDNATTPEDTPANIAVLNNDSDIDASDVLMVSALGLPSNGAAATDGLTVAYTPTLNFNGQDVFTYTISDGNGGSATAGITVTITAVNDPPLAVDDTGATDEETVLVVPAPGVLANDSDVEGGPLSVVGFDSVSAAGAGVFVNSDGAYNYDPTLALQNLSAGQVFSDTFSYTIADPGGQTASATVTVAVTGLNDPPDAVDDTATTPVQVAVVITVLDNDSDIDGDALTVTGVSDPAGGSVTTNGTTVTYTPDFNFAGVDTFTYDISDGNGGSDTATVTVTVTGSVGVFMPAVFKNATGTPVAPDLVVNSLRGSSDKIEVVIANVGTAPTLDPFWVDFYIDPSSAPTQVNQVWQDLSTEGIAWGVTVNLDPGEVLTITYSTDPGAPNLFYEEDFSFYTGVLPIGTPLYAQVDSAHINTNYGGILEIHEITGGPYNNILGPVFAEGPFLFSGPLLPPISLPEVERPLPERQGFLPGRESR